jgi:transposase
VERRRGGGVPQSVLMDNTKLAVAKILADGRRELTTAFTRLISHYVFRERFGRPGTPAPRWP